jgi:hypothetical protein
LWLLHTHAHTHMHTHTCIHTHAHTHMHTHTHAHACTHMHTHTRADEGFVVVTADRTYYFVAQDSADKFEWIQVTGLWPQT